MNILVTGGAGYIGSETVHLLVNQGHTVTVLDSLEYGHRAALPDSVEFIEGKFGDQQVLNQLFSKQTFDGLIHFAAYIQVGESVQLPSKYFTNNTASAIILFQTAIDHGLKHIVFSSTAAVYGNPVTIPIQEDDPKQPTNPYGASKLMVEEILKWLDQAHGLTSVCLRYFNASGAAQDGSRGEAHQPESHLVPLVIQTALGQRDSITIFGTDYKTDDGTCVRDYIHITDLAQAHLKALEYLVAGGASDQFNVGTGQGYSNQQVVDMVKQVSGNDFKVEYGQRRPGDPDQLIASSDRLRQKLNWQPRHSQLEDIIKSAWKWHANHPNGYEEN